MTVTPHETDHYGRVVADIVLPDSCVLKQGTGCSGNTWWYSHYDHNDAELQTLEAHA